ncbi:MAG: HD domain-containing protein [Syntrophomonadaceae bacterium]|nr:HD domain-containing protein [Syntrophomonadaceae bacterium]
MNDKYNDDFIERNSLIPLRQLMNSDHMPPGFNFALIQSQIKAEGLNPDDFYFSPGNSESPYCYYRGFMLLDFNLGNNSMAEIKNLISRLEEDINKSVAKRDFDRFLTLIDSRLAPDLFMEVINFIPDQDKYRLFERIWRYNEKSHDVFSEDFIQKVSKYKGCTSDLPVSDEEGYVQVYRSGDSKKQSPGQILYWYTDINKAITKGIFLGTIPAIYCGRVHLEHILSYDKDKKVIKVKANKVEQIETMDLLNIREFETELRDAGIVEEYNRYVKMINTGWFRNPQGIHALSHTKRVLFLSLIISYLEKYQEEDKSILCLAAIYHDIGRSNDGYDPDHGIASYDKLRREKLLEPPNRQEQEILKYLVQNHAIPDQSAYKKINRYDLSDVDRTLRLYDAFKDADGLDRVRIKDLNPEYLRTRAAHRLLLVAHQLYNDTRGR